MIKKALLIGIGGYILKKAVEATKFISEVYKPMKHLNDQLHGSNKEVYFQAVEFFGRELIDDYGWSIEWTDRLEDSEILECNTMVAAGGNIELARLITLALADPEKRIIRMSGEAFENILRAIPGIFRKLYIATAVAHECRHAYQAEFMRARFGTQGMLKKFIEINSSMSYQDNILEVDARYYQYHLEGPSFEKVFENYL